MGTCGLDLERKPHRISTSSGSGSGILLAGSSASAGNRLLSDLQTTERHRRSVSHVRHCFISTDRSCFELVESRWRARD